MYILELNDLMFCIKSLIAPTRNFDLSRHIQFCKGPTRSSASLKMVHIRSSSNSTRHSFFNRLPRLWNCLPPIDLALSPATIKKHLFIFLYDHFLANFDSNSTCSFHFLCPCALSPTRPIFNSSNGCTSVRQYVAFTCFVCCFFFHH